MSVFGKACVEACVESQVNLFQSLVASSQVRPKFEGWISSTAGSIVVKAVLVQGKINFESFILCDGVTDPLRS